MRDREPTWLGLAWISPWIIGAAAFMLIPVCMSLATSFTDDPLLESPISVGLANWSRLLTDDVFWHSLWITVLYAAISIPLCTVVSIALAGLLNVKLKGRWIFRAILFAPSIVPVVAAAMIWLWIFNGQLGLVNHLLDVVLAPFGLHGPDWLGDRHWAMVALVLVGLWGIGPSMVIYLAALRDVPTDLLEAANLDGMGWWHRFWHITIPLISPVILFNIIVGVINSMQVFALPYIMTQGGPDRSTYFYTMYLYDTGFKYGQMGYASTLAWVQLLVILGLTAITIRLGRRYVYYRSAP